MKPRGPHNEPPPSPALRIQALESLLIEKGLIDPGAIDEIVEHFEHRIGPRNGERVVARNMHPTGHTRLPRYVRGKRGIVQRHHGDFVFPDTRAHGRGDQPQHLYNVRFEARELWGEGAAEHDGIYLDLWESYLEIEGPS